MKKSAKSPDLEEKVKLLTSRVHDLELLLVWWRKAIRLGNRDDPQSLRHRARLSEIIGGRDLLIEHHLTKDERAYLDGTY